MRFEMVFLEDSKGCVKPSWHQNGININHNFKGRFFENVVFLRSSNLKIGDKRIIDNKDAITKLVAHYLVNEKNKKNLPVNDVCRFHLGNGASIEDVIINGNTTDYGYKESFGIMVNYIYKLDKLEKIHEDYINHKKISYSDKIKKYV